jgi:fatty-acyl-CoA synthase
LADALSAAACTDRAIVAVEHDGRADTIPYARLAAEALIAGGTLTAHGLRPGDRVALLVPEVGAFIRAFFGIIAAGLVPVPLAPPAQAGDVTTFGRRSHQLIIASRASALVTSADIAQLAERLALPPWLRLLAVDSLGAGPALSQPVARAADTAALLQFTSGSTSTPKGAVLTHASLLANVAAIGSALRISDSDVGVSWLPLYHDMGLIGMLLTAILTRSPAVMMSPTLFLKKPTAWLEAISRHRATISFAPNFAYELCLRRTKPTQVASLDLSSWRVAGCGAEPIRASTLAAFGEAFEPAGFRRESFVPSYGLAEHSLAVSMSTGGLIVDRVDPVRLSRESRAEPVVNGSASVSLVGCGWAFPGHDIRIVGDDGQRLADREIGHILVKGPSVMAGYFENHVATAEILSDGWLNTGDLGYVAGGSLFVCGRSKEIIIRQGRKYHPSDLESAIGGVEGLRPSGVVVFGIPRVGEADEVVAVLEARASLTSQVVVDSVRRRVREATGLDLDRIVVAPPGTIPRTTSGKVRRAETRARLEAGTLLLARREAIQ